MIIVLPAAVASAKLSFRCLLLPPQLNRSHREYISPFVNVTLLSPHIKFQTVLHMDSQICFTWEYVTGPHLCLSKQQAEFQIARCTQQ
jgi:hypothetical protein